MIPVMILDNMLKSEWELVSLDVPIVPVVLLVVNSISIIFGSSYVYLFYRSLVSREADMAAKEDKSEATAKRR